MLLKYLIGLVGLGYLIVSALRYFRIWTNPQLSPDRKIVEQEKHYLGILGLKTKATREQIKKAYRKRIAEYHPDKVQRMAPEIRELAQKRTTELTEAYNYLKAKSEAG